ncbi:hypothetical protein MTR10_11930 [Staphylococcus agnetis]|uniref:hypothetical protein n=1 Tax=Staphylococcus agnetis TaxID=985762 RepID=UPI00208E2195|nr:hypothetical protein [Staphylococcus agnetis]MCO4372747.1 hypothetical protein [Staphylococcus agnetis]
MSSKQLQFILARAACLLVEAYSRTLVEYRNILPLDGRVGLDAPSTYDGLKADAAKGFLKVSTEHNTTSIYGASGNLTFRTFHDYGHLLYARQFTTEDEVALARFQWQDLKGYLPAEWVDVCHCVYMADTVEQSLYEAQYGDFPADQKAFVLNFLQQHFTA